MNPPTCFIFYYYLWILKFPPNFFFSVFRPEKSASLMWSNRLGAQWLMVFIIEQKERKVNGG